MTIADMLDLIQTYADAQAARAFKGAATCLWGVDCSNVVLDQATVEELRDVYGIPA